MTVLWRILQAILRAIEAVQENTDAYRENTAATAGNTGATIALALEVKALRTELAQSEPMADRAGEPALSASVVNE